MRRLTALVFSCVLAAPAMADQDGATINVKMLKPEYAIKAAVAAMENCREQGYQVGVAVVDRGGNLQAFVRDRFAGPHTPETAQRKAWTAVSFRTDTLELDTVAQPGAVSFGLRFVPGALALGGGVMIQSGANMVGAIGVSGAPSPAADEACAKAGIAAIEDALGF